MEKYLQIISIKNANIFSLWKKNKIINDIFEQSTKKLQIVYIMTFYFKMKTIQYVSLQQIYSRQNIYYRTGSYVKVSKATLDQPFSIFQMKYSFKIVITMNINSSMLFSYKCDDVEKQSFNVQGLEPSVKIKKRS